MTPDGPDTGWRGHTRECLLSVHDVPAGGAIPCTCGGKRPKDDDDENDESPPQTEV